MGIQITDMSGIQEVNFSPITERSGFQKPDEKSSFPTISKLHKKFPKDGVKCQS